MTHNNPSPADDAHESSPVGHNVCAHAERMSGLKRNIKKLFGRQSWAHDVVDGALQPCAVRTADAQERPVPADDLRCMSHGQRSADARRITGFANSIDLWVDPVRAQHTIKTADSLAST